MKTIILITIMFCAYSVVAQNPDSMSKRWNLDTNSKRWNNDTSNFQRPTDTSRKNYDIATGNSNRQWKKNNSLSAHQAKTTVGNDKAMVKKNFITENGSTTPVVCNKIEKPKLEKRVIMKKGEMMVVKNG